MLKEQARVIARLKDDGAAITEPAFWAVARSRLSEQELLKIRNSVEEAHRLLRALRAEAIMEGLNSQASIGRAAREAEYSEARMRRLLSASGKQLGNELRAVASYLASKGARCNTAQFLPLTNEENEAVRQAIAFDYYN